MKLDDIAQELGLDYLTPQLSDTQAVDIAAGYSSDLLSDVLVNAPQGGVLVTLQVHLNVVAVAGHAELSAVIFSAGRKPDEAVVAKAVEEDLHLYSSTDDTFETVGRLHALGVKGQRA